MVRSIRTFVFVSMVGICAPAWSQTTAPAGNAADLEIARLERDARTRHGSRAGTEAYVRLGAMGTPASLAAIERIEAELFQTIRPQPISAIRWQWDDRNPNPVVPMIKMGQITYAAVITETPLTNSISLTWSRTPGNPDSWARPVPVGIRGSNAVRGGSLRVKDDTTLVITGPDADEPLAQIVLAELNDTDRDGWTDIEERFLGLDPTRADTDGDGIGDGEDPCPDLAMNPNATDGDREQIVRRAVLASGGIDRRILLFNRNSFLGEVDEQGPIQLRGLTAQLIRGYDPAALKDRYQFTGRIAWSRPVIDGDQATVSLNLAEGEGSGMIWRYELRRIGGQWYVTKELMALVYCG